MYHRPRYRYPLHLAARKLSWPGIQMTADAEPFRQYFNPLIHATPGEAVQSPGQGDVFLYGQLWDQMKGLKHKTHVPPPQERTRVVIQGVERLAFESHVPRIGAIQAGNNIEQGAFANAAFPHDGYEVCWCYVEARIAE
jgi:hypothetical protein